MMTQDSSHFDIYMFEEIESYTSSVLTEYRKKCLDFFNNEDSLSEIISFALDTDSDFSERVKQKLLKNSSENEKSTLSEIAPIIVLKASIAAHRKGNYEKSLRLIVNALSEEGIQNFQKSLSKKHKARATHAANKKAEYNEDYYALAMRILEEKYNEKIVSPTKGTIYKHNHTKAAKLILPQIKGFVVEVSTLARHISKYRQNSH